MRKLAIAALVCVLTAWGADAYAQVRYVEVVPFGGYRWGGSMNSITGIRDFDTQDTWSFGVALDAGLAYNSAVELYYGHFTGDWDAIVTAGEGGVLSGSLSRDDIMLNGIWYATGSSSKVVRPYFTAGLGVSIYSSDNTSATGHFAWNIGAGLRHDINNKIAIRVDGRWLPTWFTTGSSVYCNPYYYYGGCYPTSTGEFYDQFELTGGLMIKLGGV